MIALEPSQRVFDAIGAKRFYMKRDKKFISGTKQYRTEDDLTSEHKEVYSRILEQRATNKKINSLLIK